MAEEIRTDEKICTMCGFEGICKTFKTGLAWWLSWLERRPVTAEVVGSNPIRVVCMKHFDAAFTTSICCIVSQHVIKTGS